MESLAFLEDGDNVADPADYDERDHYDAWADSQMWEEVDREQERHRQRRLHSHRASTTNLRDLRTLAVARVSRAGRAGSAKPVHTRRRSAADSARASGSSSSDSGDAPGEPPSHPVWLEPRFESIPARLKNLKHRVVWRARWDAKRGRWTKPPSQTSGCPASHSNPAHWDTFECTCFTYKRGGWSGIGYVLAADDLLTGIDLDHCRDLETGKIASWALRIVKRCGSYSEVSPSGTGIRIFIIGKLPGTGRKRRLPDCGDDAAIEIYDKQRFLTLTGHGLKNSPATIKRRQRVIDAIMEEFFPKPEPVASLPVNLPVNPRGLDLADRAVLDIALASQFGREFHQLYYEGDTSAHNHDHSTADYSLIRSLTFFSGGNREQAERLFGESALVREKWLDRPGYRKLTIDAALANMTHLYDPNYYFNNPTRSRG